MENKRSEFYLRFINCLLLCISVYNNINNVYAMEDGSGGTYSTGTERSDGYVRIEGNGNVYLDTTAPITDFTDIKFIPNANYLLINPKHRENNGSLLKSGEWVELSATDELEGVSFVNNDGKIPTIKDF